MAPDTRRSGPPAPPTSAPPAGTAMLDYLTAHSVDEDYQHVARRREEEGEGEQRRRPRGAAMVVLAVFGLLVAVAAVQTSRNAEVTAASHSQLVQQVQARQRQLADQRTRARELENEIEIFQGAYLTATGQGRSLQNRLDRLSIAAGSVPVRGPGIRVVVDDAPDARTAKQRVLDVDLQKLVNALWEVGAEAIAINGKRLTTLSAIRHAGGAITVDFQSLQRPYDVSAIGNRNQMSARLLDTDGGQTWLNLQSVFGLQFDIRPEESMKLPAAQRLTLSYAHDPKERR